VWSPQAGCETCWSPQVGCEACWSPQAGCETCWSRWTVRHRTVLLEPRAGGRPCTDLAEVVACPHRTHCELQYQPSNHRFRLGRWTDCAAFHPSQAVATFGARDSGSDQVPGSRGFTSVIGYRRRSVDCIDVSGTAVDKRSVASTFLINTMQYPSLHDLFSSTIIRYLRDFSHAYNLLNVGP